MINLIFTPVDESLPELIEFSSSYAGAWKSDWVYIITKSGEIESARLSVSGNRPKPVGQDIREGGKWESCLHDHPPQHKMVKYSPVIGWAYTSDIRELASAPKAAPGERLDECFPGESRVAVPQGLISAACFAIRNKRDGGKVLEQLRRYSVGDLSQPLAPQQEAQEPGEIPESIERMATGRYKVVPSHESMFHRWAVVAGTGTRQLYLGREVECQNMARKFAGAFLDGAFVAMQQAAPQPAPAPLSDDVVRDAAFEAVRKKLCALPRFSFLSDGYGAVRRVPDKSGSWIAFDAAHALFDPVAVDAALDAQGCKAKCVEAA